MRCTVLKSRMGYDAETNHSVARTRYVVIESCSLLLGYDLPVQCIA